MGNRPDAELISCLYLLDRELGAAPEAIRQFESQTYAARELLIVDDAQLAGLLEIPRSPRIRLLQLPAGMSTAEKLRYAAQQSDGAVFCEWRAGAWQSPERLRRQARRTKAATELAGMGGTRMWRRGWESAAPEMVDGAKLLSPEPPRREGLPMVSCIMPTCNRPWAVPLAIEWFQTQDWPKKELLIIDDGEASVEGLAAGQANVRYLRPGRRMSVGAKRNYGCAHARGEFVAHWDDDDWMAPHRLSYQVSELERSGANLCGLEQMLYWEPLGGQAWRYVYPADEKRWVAGGSFLYRHKAWARRGFDEVNVGEDNQFVWGMAEEEVLPLPEFEFYVAVLHAGNTSMKLIEPTRWAAADADRVRRLMGRGAERYREALRALETGQSASGRMYLPPEAPLRPGASNQPPRFPAVEVSPFTLARRVHLELPEFAAMNSVSALPTMRQWELPFAIFQARLGEEMSVLDCTINPTCLGDAITELYPSVRYSHWTPLHGRTLRTPRVEPGAAFDRIFCINTLEHLPAAEREELMEALAGMLRTGGLLVCTLDQYFRSAWKDKAWLATGLLRADGKEVMNGYNRVSPKELEKLAGRHGLTPLAKAPAAARESDATLYTNPPPLRHGSLGAVFAKGEPALPSSRKLLLCLLSWNTREITLESLDALETEALTLQRLGHRAAICVVDNGSTDGAAEALESRRGELHVEHRIVLNPHNTGNSRARNQMIDCALEMDADYLFFCDGDIEVVPFSTFAMLRYMEAEGERLGCLGAYSFQCTPERERTTAFLYSLAGCSMQTSDVLAWTQYGLFRCRMFSEGVRFEESGPFGEPGHGLEDVDLAFQIHARGYGNHYFSGMWYLHRNLSSSVGILRAQGINPRERYFARRDYMVAKWEHHPSASGPLRWLRSAQPPWPEEETAPATLRLYPGGEEIALPAEARDLAAQAASDMLDRTELEAIGYLLAAYPWKGQEAIVVEIGAYQGRTTVFMAKILDLFGHEAKIVSIDPFERCTPDNFNPQGSYARYMKNVRDNGVDRRCLALAAFSEDAAAAVPERIGVLVIDGWHYYDAVRSDLALYLPKVVPGGYVFLDDYGPSYPDVVRAVDEFLARDSEFEVLAKSYYVVLRRRAG